MLKDKFSSYLSFFFLDKKETKNQGYKSFTEKLNCLRTQNQTRPENFGTQTVILYFNSQKFNFSALMI